MRLPGAAEKLGPVHQVGGGHVPRDGRRGGARRRRGAGRRPGQRRVREAGAHLRHRVGLVAQGRVAEEGGLLLHARVDERDGREGGGQQRAVLDQQLVGGRPRRQRAPGPQLGAAKRRPVKGLQLEAAVAAVRGGLVLLAAARRLPQADGAGRGRGRGGGHQAGDPGQHAVARSVQASAKRQLCPVHICSACAKKK